MPKLKWKSRINSNDLKVLLDFQILKFFPPPPTPNKALSSCSTALSEGADTQARRKVC